ncbi:MAG: phosphatase [Alteromonadaceae bacterium]|nr:phosphatase [Alteromonadaceae bacterium]
MGYSYLSDEWHFFEYRHFPVTQDGPYVHWQHGKPIATYVNYSEVNGNQLTNLHVNSTVEVIVDDDAKTTFAVPLRLDYPRSRLEFSAPEKLLAISDLEGNFAAAAQLLIANGVIDKKFNWCFGSGQLVLIGDMVDRGRNVVPLLWLIYKLEAQAQQAGGMVHYLIGNHERYLLDGRVKSAHDKYIGTARTTKLSPAKLWSEQFVLGQWLRSKPVVIKIGETLFVHGGISPQTLVKAPTLQSIDKEAANHLLLGNINQRTNVNSFLNHPEGPLFYRGFAKDMTEHQLSAKADLAHINNVLTHFNVSQIAIGHSLTKHIGYDYGGKVLRVDVAHSQGNSEALLLEYGEFSVVDANGLQQPLRQTNNL